MAGQYFHQRKWGKVKMEHPIIINLQVINNITPYLGLFMCAVVMFSRRYCTKCKSTSTLIVLYAFIWLGLLWADVGSYVFAPSIHTILARVLLVLSMAVLMLDIAGNTKRINRLKGTIRELKENDRKY